MPAHDEQIGKLFGEGKRISEIAAAIGRYDQYVYKRLIALGLKAKATPAAPKPVAKIATKPPPQKLLPPSRPPRVIVRKTSPLLEDQTAAMTKNDLRRMLAAAVANTAAKISED